MTDWLQPGDGKKGACRRHTPSSGIRAEKLMLSKQGQEVVFKDGYVPMPKRAVDNVHQELGF